MPVMKARTPPTGKVACSFLGNHLEGVYLRWPENANLYTNALVEGCLKTEGDLVV